MSQYCPAPWTQPLIASSHVDEFALDGHHTGHLAESYAMADEHDCAVAFYDARFCPFVEGL